MTYCSITHNTVNDFEVVQVNTGALSLGLIPELGGKIFSLKDLRTGREWLWQNPRLAYKRVQHGSSYITEADTGGWDECFPTVAACYYPSPPWAGAVLQDHGELWSQAAMLDIIERQNQITLRTRWHGVALSYAFERSVTLTSASAHLLIEYVAVNQTDAPMHFIWCAHPLLAIEPGMQLLLPLSVRFNRSLAIPADLIAQDSDLSYPSSLCVGTNEIDLTSLPDASAAIAFKLWSNPLSEGWATLRAQDGEFRMYWDAARLPQVALWMNIGAWAGDGGHPHYNLGLEPCIGAQDSLAEAITKHNLFATLSPQSARTWRLEIQLTKY
jgi:galactose mutarotase-like enzyme